MVDDNTNCVLWFHPPFSSVFSNLWQSNVTWSSNFSKICEIEFTFSVTYHTERERASCLLSVTTHKRFLNFLLARLHKQTVKKNHPNLPTTLTIKDGSSSSSIRKDCGRPPSKFSTHSTNRESTLWLATEQFCRWKGRPGSKDDYVILIYLLRV